jgi:AraC-like DNA-binding protein
MGTTLNSLDWPQVAAPVLRNGGRFPMPEHDPGVEYVSAGTVALHLYDYTARLWLGDRLVRLQPGDFTLTPAQLPTRYALDGTGYHLCVHFDTLPAGKSPLRLPLHWRPGPQGRWLNERLQEIIHLHRLTEGDSPEAKLARLAASTALQSLLLAVAVAVGSRPPASAALAATRVDGVLEQVRRHLDEHYRETLDVPALARRAGVSQNHLARKFRARHGMTLQRYVLNRRIELARHLLTTTRLPLKAVAIEAGLGNPQYFHRQFVQATGHSPSRERELVVPAGR